MNMSAGGQNRGLLTLDFENAPLGEIIEAIKGQSDYLFINKGVDVTMSASIFAENESMEKICEMLFTPVNIKYTIDGSTVIIENMPEPVEVTGTVNDADGQPVPGVAVLIKGTTAGTTTDLDGRFSLKASPANTLVFSCIGFENQEITVGNRTVLKVRLNEDSVLLESVVVIGYGVVNARDVTTAISSIKAEDIQNQAISDFRQSMVGKMPGVQVMQTSGDPEGSVMIRVRGTRSATAGNDPLYIVDGVPMENGLNNLNSNDIESMEVLKDASSAAIYGSRGSNGVILITTKKGHSDRLSVSYDGYYGLEQVSKKIDLMNAYEYAQLSKEAHDAAYLDLNPGGTAPNGSRPESYLRPGNRRPDMFPGRPDGSGHSVEESFRSSLGCGRNSKLCRCGHTGSDKRFPDTERKGRGRRICSIRLFGSFVVLDRCRHTVRPVHPGRMEST